MRYRRSPTPSRARVGVLFSLFAAFVLILAGCTGIARDGASADRAQTCLSQLGERSAATSGVFVEPDDGYEPVIEELAAAQCTVDLTIYMLTDDTIFDALTDAASRGVRVRVILDEHPYGMFGDQQEAMDRLLEGGVEVQWGPDTHQFTHAKYMVIDGRVALIMNQNLTRSAFNGNREFGLVTTEPDAVAQAEEIFKADWTRSSSEGIAGPLVVSPENSRQRIMQMIWDAEVSIDFYAEVIRDTGIIAALEEAVERGVAVRLIVNGTVDPEDLEALADLSEAGVEVRMMETLYIHAKTIIFDSESALIGSQNYTTTSLERNREVGIVVDDPRLVARVVAIYQRDWLRAIPSGSSLPSPPNTSLANVGRGHSASGDTSYRTALAIPENTQLRVLASA